MENPRDASPAAAQTTMCQAGCGFYGSPATDGLCSKCFKESLKRKQDPGRLTPTSISSEPHRPVPSTSFPIVEKIVPKIEREEPVVASTSRKETKKEEEGGAEESSSTLTLASTDSTQSEEAEDPLPSKKKNRCHECNKRVGLTGFNCRCGGVYCGIHRYSDMHKCTFDYKRLGEEEIRKNNPVVGPQKIEKI